MTDDLIQRLESATGPDRQLGNDILLACGWSAVEYGDGPARSLVWSPPHEGMDECIDGEQPDPTASIDAALTLVPEVWQAVYLTREWTGVRQTPEQTKHRCTLRRSVHSYVEATGDGASLATALCIAALKARAAGNANTGTE